MAAQAEINIKKKKKLELFLNTYDHIKSGNPKEDS